MTYRDLNSWANKVAAFLKAFVTKADTTVALNLPRTSVEFFAGFLGVLKSGASVLMLDASVPLKLKQYMLTASEAVLVIGDHIDDAMCQRISWEEVAKSSDCKDADYTEGVPAPWMRPDSAATVLFTSGSTGLPKGLRNPHNAYVHFHKHNSEALKLGGKGFVVAQMAKLGFDVSIREFFLPWCVGATLCVMPDNVAASGDELGKTLGKMNVGAMCCVPSVLASVDQLPDCLRVVYFAGEAVTAELVAHVVSETRIVVNGYGTSETPMSVCKQVFTDCSSPITLGQPVPGMMIALMEGEEIMPAGEVGEICVGGVQLTLGYLDPKNSATRLFNHPIHGRMYRTGDRGRINADGSIEFLGRQDDQVKVAGNRLELGTVDAVLSQVWAGPAMSNLTQGGRLVGYVQATPNEGSMFQDGELKTLPPARSASLQLELGKLLPSYGVPSQIYMMAALPRTTVSRKLCRRMLPEPSSVIASGELTGTPVENWVIETVRSVLEDPTALPDDKVLTCGGTSILMTQLVKKLRTDKKAPAEAHAQQPSLTLSQVLQAGSWRELASSLQAVSRQGSKGKTVLQIYAAYLGTQGQKLSQKPYSHSEFTYRQLGWLFVMKWKAAMVVAAILQQVFSRGAVFSATITTLVCWLIIEIGFTIAIRVILGMKFKPGIYPQWGPEHLKMWRLDLLAQPIIGILARLEMHRVLSAFLRLMGAKVGRNVYWPKKPTINGFDLLEIGDNCLIGGHTVLEAIRFVDGHLVMGKIKLGDNCIIGQGSYVAPGVTLKEGCRLRSSTALQSPVESPPNTKWSGNPAVPEVNDPASEAQLEERLVQKANSSSSSLPFAAWVFSVIQVIIKYSDLCMATYIKVRLVWPNLSEVVIAYVAGRSISKMLVNYMVCVMVASVSVRLAKTLFAIICIRLLPKITPGVYSDSSAEAKIAKLKVDMFEQLQKKNAGSPFICYIMAAAGMKIYPKVGNLEFGRMEGILPDTFSISACNGSGANTCSLSVDRPVNGVCVIKQTALPSGCFIGNMASLAPSIYRQNLLIGVGVHTAQDSFGVRAMATGSQDEHKQSDLATVVVGNPPLELQRAVGTSDDESAYEPTLFCFAFRAALDLLRCVACVPPYLSSALIFSIVAKQFTLVDPTYQVHLLVLLLPVCLIVHFTLLTSFFICAKWIIVGRPEPKTCSMWDNYVYRHFFMWRLFPLVHVLYSVLGGTLALNPLLRALGVKVGKRALINRCCKYFDADMLSVGDDALLHRPKFQIHTFEDRVFKMYRTCIGNGSTLTNSIVIGGAVLEDNAHLMPRSCISKGEELLEGKTYAGYPVRIFQG
eukprot:TRINITY_DN3694_c0_g1_i3.p1 TRINITY_DN3694_c0_g1~~TRINITY_DN3694_c0_g1_i3.p1  ORF type:complete len:1402 (+),score=240.08 TRINITY_DN3694_c0_g1_i3:253-4206(+)